MKVTVGGKDYEIDGVIYGTLPAWKLIKHEGKPMTGDSFNALTDADKQELFQHVQRHIESLNRR